jgi:hypothetical protein
MNPNMPRSVDHRLLFLPSLFGFVLIFWNASSGLGLSSIQGGPLAVADTLQSLQTELARRRKLVAELRAIGHTGFAVVLEESVEKLVSAIANLAGATAASPEPVAQQQQQIQPKKED